MEVHIRPAMSEDIPAIRAIATDAWYAAHAPIVGEGTVAAFLGEYYTRQAFVDWIAEERTILDVAMEDRPRGYVLALPQEEPAGTYGLAHVYVDPDHWGEGIGTRLLGHVETRIRESDGDRVTLGVMTANERAIGFYEDAGYERIAESYDERIDTRSYTYAKELD